MLLPWEYGVRNLARRPLRTVLTLLALATVILLVFVLVGFIRGLQRTLANSGEKDVVLIYSVSSESNLESSAISARTPELLTASVTGTRQRFGVDYVSPEIYLGTRVELPNHESLGLVRGVTRTAPLVRRNVRLIEGDWPGAGEVMVGSLVATKLGCDPALLSIGSELQLEGRSWKVAGRFVASGTAYESEIWCPLDQLQSASRRQDLTLVAMALEPGQTAAEIDLFCKQRTDLELQAINEVAYYQSLQQHYQPVRFLAWMVVVLVAAAGGFAGLNMMYGAVAGRIREIATLQAIGYRRRSILISIMQEGLLVGAAASLLAGGVALLFLNNVAVRITMGAFALKIDSAAILIGCSIGLALGVLGAFPPALKALRYRVAESLKAI